MKPNQEPENDAALQEVLQEWVVDAPLPPRFQEQVWQRLTQAETRPSLLTLWRSTLLALQGSLCRPKLASSYVAVLLAVGVAAGSWAAQKHNSRLEASLESRYLQSVDPYQPASPGR
jgi:hypothetical protein